MRYTYIKTALLVIASLFLIGKDSQGSEKSTEEKVQEKPQQTQSSEQLHEEVSVEKLIDELNELKNKPAEQKKWIIDQFKHLALTDSPQKPVLDKWLNAIEKLHGGKEKLEILFEDAYLSYLKSEDPSDKDTLYLKSIASKGYVSDGILQEEIQSFFKERLEARQHDPERLQKELKKQYLLLMEFPPKPTVFESWVRTIEGLDNGKRTLVLFYGSVKDENLPGLNKSWGEFRREKNKEYLIKRVEKVAGELLGHVYVTKEKK